MKKYAFIRKIFLFLKEIFGFEFLSSEETSEEVEGLEDLDSQDTYRGNSWKVEDRGSGLWQK